jgi:pimeloyl-ACP methyl ester carboxylesterase
MLQAWPAAHQELCVPTCQGDTFILTCGPQDAPPVVLLHGGATTSVMWLRNLSAWSQRFRIYAIDIIGEPGFSAPSRPSLTSDDHARWLDDVWDALSIQRASLVGASFGGLIALDFAIRRPAKVEKLALLAPAGVSASRLSFSLKAGPLLFMGPWGRRKALDVLMKFRPEEMTPESESFVRFFRLTFEHYAFRMAPLPVFGDAQLRTLTMPVMAVVGGQDSIFKSEVIRKRLETCVPNARVHFLPEARHGLTDQTATVLEFLTGSQSSH